jgi:hypothetical protein
MLSGAVQTFDGGAIGRVGTERDREDVTIE